MSAAKSQTEILMEMKESLAEFRGETRKHLEIIHERLEKGDDRFSDLSEALNKRPCFQPPQTCATQSSFDWTKTRRFQIQEEEIIKPEDTGSFFKIKKASLAKIYTATAAIAVIIIAIIRVIYEQIKGGAQ